MSGCLSRGLGGDEGIDHLLLALYGLSGGEGHWSSPGVGRLSLCIQGGDHVHLIWGEIERAGGFGRLAVDEGGTGSGEVWGVGGIVELTGGDHCRRELVLIGIEVFRPEVLLRRSLELGDLVIQFGSGSDLMG